MKYLLMFLAAALLAAGFAYATEKPKSQTEPSVPYYGGRATETEPNDDCTQADGPIVDGDAYDGEITSDDYDWYEFNAAGGECMIFETHETAGQPTVDTYMHLYDSDCTTELAYDDDGGSGAYSRIQYDFTTAGTYYVVVRGYSSSSTGFYTLTADACPAPPPNPTCETAIDLQEQGLSVFNTNNCMGVDDYSPTNYCTGYSMAHGEDIVYKIDLTAGETLTVTLTDEDYDASLYLLTDCSDMESCVAGGDDPEEFTYVAEADGTYYIIVDGYYYDYCGNATITIDAPVDADGQTWGSFKSLYR